MRRILQESIKQVIKNSISFQAQMPKLSSGSIILFRFWKSLLELSYLLQFQNSTYSQLIAFTGRPQYINWFPNLDYASLFISVLYFLNIIWQIKFMKCFTFIIIIINTNLLNFFVELSQGQVMYPAQLLLTMIYLWNIFIVTGTLDIDTSNFQITENNFCNILASIMNVLMMICQIYIQNRFIMISFIIFSSLFQVINQIYYNPFKDRKCQILLTTIYIITIYLSLINFFEVQNQFTVEFLVFPMFTRIIYTQFNIYYRNKYCDRIQLTLNDQIINQYIHNKKQQITTTDKFIFASIMISDKKLFQAYLYLRNIKSGSIITKLKLNNLKQKCISKIEIHVQQNNFEQNQMQLAVKALIENENQSYQLIQNIVDLIKEKIQVYQFMCDNTTNLNSILKYTLNLLQFKSKLESIYEQYPSLKTQSILGFFYSEIMNDFISAIKLFDLTALSDDKIRRNLSDLFSKKIVYLITHYKSNTLQINRFSNNAPDTLGLTGDQLIKLSIEKFVPKGIQKWHDKLLQSFMQNGDCKYLRRFDKTFYQAINDQAISTLDLAIDFNFITEVNFICFFEQSLSQPMVLILNDELLITGVSKTLIKQIDSNESYLLNKNVNAIIPQFDINLEYQEQINVIFTGKKQHLPQLYIANINIIYKKLNNQLIYCFLIFESIKKKQNDYYTQTIQNITDQNYQVYAEESVMIQIPHDSIFEIQSQNIKVISSQEGFESEPYQNQLQETLQKFNTTTVNKLDTYRGVLQQSLIGQNIHSPLEPNSNIKSFDHEQIYEDKALNDSASQISSLLGIRQSKFYKKYKIIMNIDKQQTITINHQNLIIIFILTFTVQIILASLVILQITISQQLVQINRNFTNLVSDIDLLQIKNLIYQPLESFLVTRWTIVDYGNLRDQGIISQTQYAFYVTYPKSNLALGYDSLYENVIQVINRKELQPLLQDSKLTAYLYISTGVGEAYEMTLRNCINVLLNYQYQFKMAYVLDGSAQSDSPYAYFSYKNYLNFKNLFSQLNDDILEQTIQRCNIMNSQSTTIFSVQIALLSLMQCYIYLKLRKIYDRYARYFEILFQCDLISIEEEILSLKIQLEKIQKSQEYLFKYNLCIDKYEQQYTQISDQLRKRQKNNKSITLHSYEWNIFFIILFLIIINSCILTYYQTSNYFNKYPDTAIFYKQVSDVGTDVPTMFAQREIIYGRSYFVYFNDDDFASFMDEVIQGVNRTKLFTNEEQDFRNYLLSESFIEYYSNLQNSNLCPNLPDNIKEKSQTICEMALNSNMNRGLKLVLIYMVNLIQTEMAINQFTYRKQPTYLELEGAFQVSELIKLINKKFNQDLNQQTTSLLNQIITYNIIVLIFIGLIILYGLIQFPKSLKYKLYLVQRIMYIVPRKTLFYDDTFELSVRNLFATDIKI